VECAEAVKQAKRRAAREFRNNSGLMTWIGRAKATNRKKTVIRRWRRTNYQEGVEEAVKEGNLWRLARRARKQAGETIEAPQISSLHWQGEEARTKEEKAELLSKKFFLPELDADLSDISKSANLF
jgi:hypothetical protein